MTGITPAQATSRLDDLTAVLAFGYPTFDDASARGREDRRPPEDAASLGQFGEWLALDG